MFCKVNVFSKSAQIEAKSFLFTLHDNRLSKNFFFLNEEVRNIETMNMETKSSAF